MFRKARLIVPLVRSLLLGPVVLPSLMAAGLVAGGTVLVGCEDEDDWHTHAERMKDPQKRKDPNLNRQAIKRLIQAYSDADSEDKKDPNKPKTKELLDQIMDPLAQVCLEESVKEQDRSKLVKFMADTRDPRAEPCLKKTLEDYAPDQNEDDVTNVLLAVTAMKQKSLMPQVMAVFKKMEFARPKAKPMGAHIIKAMKVLADKSNEDEYLKMLEPDIDSTNPQAAVNQGFWQQTAAYMLGEIKSDKAAKPLLKLILQPSKAPLHQAALLSLVKIGKAAVAPAEALVKGEDKELMKFSEEETLKGATKDTNGKIADADRKAAAKAYLPIAAEVLGNLGSEASTAPLLAVISANSDEKTGDQVTRVIATLSLATIPKSPQAEEAYKKTYEDTKLDLDIPGGGAKELLASRVSDFMDPALTPWLIKAPVDPKADPKGKAEENHAETDPVRQVAYVAAVKLMTADQVGEVEAFGNTKAVTEVQDEKGQTKKKDTTVGEAFKDQFGQAKALVSKCASDVKCYIAAATSDENQKKEKEFTAIKAMYMVGMLGKDAERDQLVEALPKIPNDAVRATGLKVIESMTPKNGGPVADKLKGYFDKAEELKDTEKMQQYNIFLQSAARLRARSQ